MDVCIWLDHLQDLRMMIFDIYKTIGHNLGGRVKGRISKIKQHKHTHKKENVIDGYPWLVHAETSSWMCKKNFDEILATWLENAPLPPFPTLPEPMHPYKNDVSGEE